MAKVLNTDEVKVVSTLQEMVTSIGAYVQNGKIASDVGASIQDQLNAVIQFITGNRPAVRITHILPPSATPYLHAKTSHVLGEFEDVSDELGDGELRDLKR